MRDDWHRFCYLWVRIGLRRYAYGNDLAKAELAHRAFLEMDRRSTK